MTPILINESLSSSETPMLMILGSSLCGMVLLIIVSLLVTIVCLLHRRKRKRASVKLFPVLPILWPARLMKNKYIHTVSSNPKVEPMYDTIPPQSQVEIELKENNAYRCLQLDKAPQYKSTGPLMLPNVVYGCVNLLSEAEFHDSAENGRYS